MSWIPNIFRDRNTFELMLSQPLLTTERAALHAPYDESVNDAQASIRARMSLQALAVSEFIKKYRRETRTILQSDFCMILEIVLGCLALVSSKSVFSCLEACLVPFLLRNLILIYLPCLVHVIVWRGSDAAAQKSRLASHAFWLTQFSSILVVSILPFAFARRSKGEMLMGPVELVVFLFSVLHFISLLIPVLLILQALLCTPFARRRPRMADALVTVQVDNEHPGLSPEEVSRLPTISVSTTFSHCQCVAVCAVCQEKLVAGDVLRQLSCQHLFHTCCVDEWLVLRATCPLCRRSVEPGTVSIPIP